MTDRNSPSRAPRDARIDLARGAALIFIFWDHVPGSLLGHLTPRNVGFSDAAEWFVILAGCAAMLAYGRTYQRSGLYAMSMQAIRRAGVLYVAHVFLLALLMAIVLVANDQVLTRDFVAEVGLGYFLQQPQHALIGGLLLTFKPMLMDPLPLYIVLVLTVPIVIPALLRWPVATTACSFALYAVANLYHVNLPSRPEGVWFFNPLAWQFLFLLGALFVRTTVVEGETGQLRIVVPRWLARAGLGYIAASALLALSWRWPMLHDAVVPEALGRLVYPISKTELAPLRLLHVLALAACAGRYLQPGQWLQRTPARALAAMGRHSLHVFCAGVLLAPVADAVNALSDERIAVQLATGLAGVAFMWGVALVLEEYRRLRQPEPLKAVLDQRRIPTTRTS